MRPGERALFHAEAGTVLADAAMRALMTDAVDAGVEVSSWNGAPRSKSVTMTQRS